MQPEKRFRRHWPSERLRSAVLTFSNLASCESSRKTPRAVHPQGLSDEVETQGIRSGSLFHLGAFFAVENSATPVNFDSRFMREQMTEFPSINAKNDHSPLRFTSQGPLGTVFLSYPRCPSEMAGFSLLLTIQYTCQF